MITASLCTHGEWLRPFLDDKAFYEVCEDVGFDHGLRGRSSLPLTTPTAGHGQGGGGRGGGVWRSGAACGDGVKSI